MERSYRDNNNNHNHYDTNDYNTKCARDYH